jgi:hypothetical protein
MLLPLHPPAPLPLLALLLMHSRRAQSCKRDPPLPEQRHHRHHALLLRRLLPLDPPRKAQQQLTRNSWPDWIICDFDSSYSALPRNLSLTCDLPVRRAATANDRNSAAHYSGRSSASATLKVSSSLMGSALGSELLISDLVVLL